MQIYGPLCSLYYDLDVVHGALEELPFYRVYAQKADGPILEPMCGTGNFLIPFTKEGFVIEGFDASHAMLERLRAKAAVQGIAPVCWQGLLQELDCPTRYSLIFIPNCSFNLITDLHLMRVCLQKIYAHLKEGGFFVCEILTTHATPTMVNVWTEKSRLLENGTELIVRSFTEPPHDFLVNTEHQYILSDGDSILKTEVEEFLLRLYDPMQFDHILKEIGFRSVRQVKVFVHNAIPHKSDDVIVYECVK